MEPGQSYSKLAEQTTCALLAHGSEEDECDIIGDVEKKLLRAGCGCTGWAALVVADACYQPSHGARRGDVRTMAILHQQRSPSSRFPKYQNTRYGDDFVETRRVVRAGGGEHLLRAATAHVDGTLWINRASGPRGVNGSRLQVEGLSNAAAWQRARTTSRRAVPVI